MEIDNKKLEELEKQKQDLQALLNIKNEWEATNKRLVEEWEKQDVENQKRREELDRKEKETVNRVKAKLKVDWSDEMFQKCVFRELEKAGFKRLSFLSDMLGEWDLSHLTGYPALLAQVGLALDRKTDEIQFYRDLFAQLDREKLVHFLAWAVACEELDESVIDEIVPPFTDDDVRQIIESWGAKITDDVKDCPKCHFQSGIPSGLHRACFKCAKWSLQTRERMHIPSMWEEMYGDTRYLCECRSRKEGYNDLEGFHGGYDYKCDFHK